MMPLKAVTIWTFLSAVAAAETVVVPNNQATAAGNFPLSLSANPSRFQEIIGSGQFSGTPITIVALRIRSNPGTGQVSYSYASLKITLSTTQAYPNTNNSHTLPSATFTNNVGPDATVVYNGPVSGSSPGCASPGPCTFDINLPLTTPFAYDPSKGRLLIDVISSAASAPFVGRLDGVSFTDTTTSTVATVSGDPSQPTGTVNTAGLVFALDTGTPCSTGGGAMYPCSVGGTLLVTSTPTGTLFGGGGGGGGGGASTSIINDPQNPGFSFALKSPLQGPGPGQFSFNGSLDLATVSSLPTITGGSASVTCGVTGSATASLTITLSGNQLVVTCPKLASPGASMMVTNQISFAGVSSLTMTLALSGNAPSSSDSIFFSGYSVQAQIGLSAQVPTVTGLVNGADFSPGVAPGALVQVYGANLWNGTAQACPANGCSGLTVTVGGKAAYVTYASSNNLVIQIPYEAAGGASSIAVKLGGTASAQFPITVATVAPAFFTQNSSKTGAAVVATPTGSFITYGSPAHSNDSLFAPTNGLGITNPATNDGLASTSNPAAVTPLLSIGGMSSKVTYAGSVKGQLGDQVNFTVPSGLQGTQPIVLTSGTTQSSSTVSLPIAGISRLVSNGGFGSAGMAAPGEIATLFANGLGTTDQLTGFPATTFQGIQVTLNGTAAPLFHLVASTAQKSPSVEQQIDLLTLQELPTSGMVNIQLTTPAGVYPNYSITMAPAVPGLFRILDPNNSKHVNITATFPNSAWLALPVSTTSALNLPTCSSAISLASYCGQPATIGDTLIIWMTGLGITTPNGDPNGKPLGTGQIPPADGSVIYETPTLPTVTIGGITAKVIYSALAPGYPGDYQVAVQVPAGIASGDDVPVVVTMFGNADTATLSVQPRS